MTSEPPGSGDDLPLAFEARYAGECSLDGCFFAPGDEIRADGLGGWECAEHAG